MTETQLYWILQENELNNENIYLPADTPTGNPNPRRLRAIYKKQHARQRERLLNQQVAELNDYRKDFATKFKDDLFIKPTKAVCELMNGPEFLSECNDEIMELLTLIPQMGQNTNKVIFMNGLSDSIVPEDKPLASPLRPLPEASSDDDMDISDDEESLIEAYEKKDDDDDGAIQERKTKYSDILKRKYRKGFSKLKQLHTLQYKKLKEFQREDLAAIPEDTPPPVEVVVAVDDVDNQRSKPKEKDKGKEKGKAKAKEKQAIGGRANEQQIEALNSVPHATQKILDVLNRKPTPNAINTLNEQRSNDKNAKWAVKNYNTNTIPVIATKSNPPSVAIAKPFNVAMSGPPPVITSAIPPVVTSSGPPVVAASGRKRGKNKQRRESNQPLFNSKPMNFKPKVLLDNNGSITIKSKPDRVIINGTIYGSPKDFDDAINKIPREDNFIHRRHLNGESYLYHKSQNGKFVALGTVSKIQPFIHKFLLSR